MPTPTALDIKLQLKALELIDQYGKVVVLRTSTKTPDPDNRSVIETNVVLTTVKASPPQGYKKSYIDGDLIQFGDLQIFIAGKDLAITPVLGMDVTFDGFTYEVLGVNPTYSGELIALWELQLRQ